MIEDLLAAQAALESARRDALTGLPNRGLFHELRNQTCADAQREGHGLALLFVDLDRFKHVNDTMGHDAGDELLIQVSARLRACVRERDVVARLGGDEFTVILSPLTDKETSIRMAERIVSDLQMEFALSLGLAQIGGSIGIFLGAQIRHISMDQVRNGILVALLGTLITRLIILYRGWENPLQFNSRRTPTFRR